MIHILLPYYPSNASLEAIGRCLLRQSCPITLYSLDTQKYGLYWANAMHWLYEMVKALPLNDNEIICFMNTDISFNSDFFKIVEKNVKQGEILVPFVYEDGKLVDGGMHIDWSKKKFTVATLHERIDCFSPRGICMTVKTFRESGGFRYKLLPHYGSDYDWSIRQIKRGIKAKRVFGLNVYHQKHDKPKVSRFSKLSNRNPIYWSIFILLHCPLEYIPINLLKAWMC